MSQLVQELKRKIAMAIGLGDLTKINDNAPLQKIQVNMLEGETHSDYDRVQEYGFTSVPLPGAQAVVVCVGGGRDNGIVVGTEDRRHRLKNLEAGEVAIYNNLGNFIKLKADGTMHVLSSHNVQVEAPTVTITGNLQVNGNIVANGNITDQNTGSGRSMASMRSLYNSHTHTETGSTTNPASPSM
jgi:phage baseplate assembly protein V